jgi:hypothetical protein
MRTTEASSSVQKHINIFFIIMVCFMKSSVVFVAKIRISLWFALFKSVFCDFIGKDISFLILLMSVKVFVLFYFVVRFWSG